MTRFFDYYASIIFTVISEKSSNIYTKFYYLINFGIRTNNNHRGIALNIHVIFIT